MYIVLFFNGASNFIWDDRNELDDAPIAALTIDLLCIQDYKNEFNL